MITKHVNNILDNWQDKIQSTISTGQQTPTSFLYKSIIYMKGRLELHFPLKKGTVHS